jgi:DNA-binding MarR family transcriptional regulator
MNAGYQLCRQQLSRLSFYELLVFDVYGRQHRDPDDIAEAMGLSPDKVIAQLENLEAKLQPIADLIPWMGVSVGDQLRAVA